MAGTSKTAHHTLARKLKRRVRRCEWRRLGGCEGRLDVAHVDGNPANNSRANLLKLCRSHHALMDRGRIAAAAPSQPGFYRTGADGKRRYLHPAPGQAALFTMPAHSRRSASPTSRNSTTGTGSRSASRRRRP